MLLAVQPEVAGTPDGQLVGAKALAAVGRCNLTVINTKDMMNAIMSDINDPEKVIAVVSELNAAYYRFTIPSSLIALLAVLRYAWHRALPFGYVWY